MFSIQILFQGEREAKYALKKELDGHLNRESMYHISNLAYSIRSNMEDNASNNSDGEEENLALKRLEADLSTELKSPDGTKCDLFSEIHLNELKKFEKQLESMESEKTHLTANLREAQTSLDKSQNELQNFMSRLALLAAHVDALVQLKKQIDVKEQGKDSDQKKDELEQQLRALISQYANWFTLSAKEIDGLKTDIDLENELKQLRHELERVRNERDRMLQENSDFGRDKSDNEADRLRLKSELKDLKFRETRMLSEYSELEEENISLQKQVSNLRSSQVSLTHNSSKRK